MPEASFEKAKALIGELVQKFESISKDPQAVKRYNEENTKNEFIEPFFEALGWDVRNRKVYDEVLKEQRVLRGRADYAFRLNGVNRFFVEAKSLKTDINNPDYAKQAIEYGFNKGVPYAILTDFEGLKVFNCEWNEQNVFRASVIDLNYTQYLAEFEKIWLLSRQSTSENKLEEYAKTIGKRIPRKGVLELLSNDLMQWREKLSKNIKANFPEKYSQEEIDEIIQRYVDRIIFIRTAEDRQLEEHKLREAINEYRNGNKSLSPQIKQVFDYYKEHYDSNLFGAAPEDRHEADTITFDDVPLVEVLDATYESKDGNIGYQFDSIDADVLGNAYEQYLGYLLKTTAKRAKTEYEHAHRKEQGIYYTPKYIVDYIVRNTLGEAIKGKTPAEIEKIRVLDSACGSGSFLIAAFEELRNYHLLKGTNQKKLEDDFDLKEATKILKNNIYGVDLDEKAVQIAQLNLMLKAAEKRHRLPLLRENIKCGNSLIDDRAVAGDRAFNWNEKFPEAMKNGGFDVIIGNPPWGAKVSESEKGYFRVNYSSARNLIDTFALFIEQANKLAKDGGRVGFVLPDIILLKNYPAIRKIILDSFAIEKIKHEGMAFTGVNLYAVTIILRKERDSTKRTRNATECLLDAEGQRRNIVPQESFLQNEGMRFNIFIDKRVAAVKRKIDAGSERFDKLFEAHEGIHSGNVREKLFVDKKVNANCRPLIFGREEIRRYYLKWAGKYANYSREIIDRAAGEYAGLGKPDFFEQPKIMIRRTGDRLFASYDENKYYASNNVFVILPNPDAPIKVPLSYLLALLNSKLFTYYFRIISPRTKQLFAELKIVHLNQFPIKYETKYAILGKLALEEQAKVILLGSMHETDSKQKLEREIADTDRRIDELVFDLYGLSAEERRIVEESVK